MTGLFTAMWLICDKITNDQEINIFHAVKEIRMARPEFIPTEVNNSTYFNNFNTLIQ